jgi:hypothetical protein
MDFLGENLSTIKKKQDNISNEFTDNENDNNFISKSEVDKKIKDKKEKNENKEEVNNKRKSIEKIDKGSSKENKIKEVNFSSKENKTEKSKNLKKNPGKENNAHLDKENKNKIVSNDSKKENSIKSKKEKDESEKILNNKSNKDPVSSAVNNIQPVKDTKKKLKKPLQEISNDSFNNMSFGQNQIKEEEEEYSNNYDSNNRDDEIKLEENEEPPQFKKKDTNPTNPSQQEDFRLKQEKLKKKGQEIKNDLKKEEIRGFKKPKSGKMEIVTESQFIREAFIRMQEEKPIFKLVEEDEDQFFGVNNRYSRRTRVPRLNRIAGERIEYTLKKDPILGVCIPSLFGVIKNKNESTLDYANSHRIKPKKKKLKKGLKKIKEEDENSQSDQDNNNDYDDDEDLPADYDQENDSDREEDIVMIPARCQKGVSKNFQVRLNCEIIESQAKNKFVIGKEIFRNLKQGNKFFVSPGAEFNFLNYSNGPLRVKVTVLNDKI